MGTTNISKVKREKMLNTINEIKSKITDEETLSNLSLIEAELTKKKYGLIWEEHLEKVDEELKTQIPTFEDIKEKEIISNPDDKFNFLLEGDNLHSLYLLEKTHKEKIDVIYIDPPYNTGNKDFMYNDRYVENDDGYRHSKWLSFMNKRLKLARNLLKEDGIIFISIDDNEQAQLKLLADNIFGENNFVACIINQSANSVYGSKAANKNKTYIKIKDYLLVYKKDNSELDLKPLYTPARSYLHDSHDFIYENGNKLSTTDWFNKNYEKLFLKYNLKISKKNIQRLLTFDVNFRKDVIKKILDIQYRTVGDYDSDKLNEEEIKRISNGEIIQHDGRLLYAENKNHTSISTLRTLRESCQVIEGEMRKCDILGDIWNTSSGYQNINAEGGVKFKNGKKPVVLIKNILKSINKPNAIVLDFFAGSGTTGHAVLDLNKEDGGNRKFILCTNNENNICEEITYKRIKNVIDGYGKYKPLRNNLKYYKCTYVPRINTENENLHNNLLINIKNLIQLENGIKIDDKKIQVYLDEDRFDEMLQNKTTLEQCEKLYISSDILLTKEQKRIIENNNIELFVIPEYYFKDEIMEATE